jgi:hypothetical protein
LANSVGSVTSESLGKVSAMSQRSPDSPTSKRNKANVIADLVLQTCRSVDTAAHIASVMRDSEGRTVVKIRTGLQSEPVRMLRALKVMWPLAKSSVSENPLDGISEAEITVPRERDERERAWRRASNDKLSEFLLLLFYVLLFMFVLSYVRDCKRAFELFNASSSQNGWS